MTTYRFIRNVFVVWGLASLLFVVLGMFDGCVGRATAWHLGDGTQIPISVIVDGDGLTFLDLNELGYNPLMTTICGVPGDSITVDEYNARQAERDANKPNDDPMTDIVDIAVDTGPYSLTISTDRGDLTILISDTNGVDIEDPCNVAIEAARLFFEYNLKPHLEQWQTERAKIVDSDDWPATTSSFYDADRQRAD